MQQLFRKGAPPKWLESPKSSKFSHFAEKIALFALFLPFKRLRILEENHIRVQSLLYTAMDLNVIVYNKTRKLAGHSFKIAAPQAVTVAELKKLIEKTAGVPAALQWICYGSEQLEDSIHLEEIGIRSGYTIYSTPTLVEIPNMPNL